MDENDIYSALDIQPPEEPAESSADPQQGDATPAVQQPQADTGEPAPQQERQETTARDGDAGTDDDSDDGSTASDTGEQTPEQRRENAAKRRRAEQQAAIDAAIQKAVQAEQQRNQEQIAAFFQSAQLKNTLTGQPITNMSEFDEWKRAFEAAKLERDLKSGKLSPQQLDQAISQNPIVQQAQQVIAQQKQAAEQSERQAAQARIDAELLEIQKLDPTIKTVQDLLHMPKAQQFYELVKKGNSFLDAYRLANFEVLTARTASASRQQALTNARGKDHLRSSSAARGRGASSVPSDELRLFRELMPDASEADIQAYYNKYTSKE